MRTRFVVGLAALAIAVGGWSLAQPPRGQRGQQQPGQEPTPAPPVQPRGLQPHAFVITDAKVVTEPGQVLPTATIVIRDGLIEAVGADVKAPPDALKIDGKGLTVYPGFVDACGTWGFDTAMRRSEVGPPSAEDLASETLVATKSDNRKGLTPEFNVNAALKTDTEAEDTWRKVGFTSHLIAPDGGFMGGQSAVISHSGAAPREAILRAPFAMHFALRTTGGPGAGEGYPRALMGVFAHCRQTLLDAQHYQRLHAAFEKNGGVGKRPPYDPSLEALLPVLDGKIPVIMEADGRDNIHRSLDFAAEFNLKPIITGGREAWKVANRLKKENVPVILRLGFAEPNEEREKDLPKRALDERRRIRAEEVQTAKMLLDAGVVVVFGTAGLGDRASEKFQGNIRKMIAAGLSPDAALAALTTTPAKLFGLEGQLGRIAAGRPAHLFVTNGDFHAERTQAKMAFADGVRFEFDAPAAEEAQAPRGGRGPGGAGGGGGRFAGGRGRGDRSGDDKTPAPFVGPPTVEDENTEIEADRKPALKTDGNVLIKNATVFTVSNGTKPNCDILVKNGKIAEIGSNLKAPDGTKVLDATGLSVMPGIIDTHAHFASSGGLNEFSLSVVPEVRVRDVVEGDDVQIYRALAGGVTTARILHGSANCVGGQDAVLKMKYGSPGRELIVTDGPRGVKFALGENVKRTDGRFPNSRLGVEAVLIRAFTEAQEYRKTWDSYEQAKKAGKPVAEPRRDLRLEALADILKGDLKVHCHCYRADEILMLLRVADKFGFKIKSLQHVLEGYKIAPEIAAHGASVSLFSDWWAYKIEAFDAIPFAAALLRAAGATVCLKSDSNELMRHMYQEATKLIKYGGLSEADAFASITLNAAKQLGIDQRTGSLDVGKDADIAIFSGHPLNSFSRVELTLVEGEVYFQRSPQLKAETIAAAPPVVPRDHPFKLPDRVAGPIAIRGATIHPVSGPPIPNGTVVIDHGRIRAVGANGSATIPPNATIIQAEGLHLYPGMIDAGTVLGLAEIESSRETNDFREGGDFQPDLRASIAINPDSELIPVTRANGVTTVVTRPSGSMVAGQSVLLNLSGWTPREMTVVDGLALNVDFPPSVSLGFGRGGGGNPGAEGAFGARGLQRRQRDEKVKRLRELFAQAIAYDEGRKLSPSTPANPRLEAVVPYARGEKPVVMQVTRKADILEVLKLADELKLKIILSGATDAWRVADEIKKRDIPVIVGPIMAMPSEREDPFDAPFTAPAKLHAAGIRYCIRTGITGGANSGSSNTRNLPYEAAFAVSYGLPEDEGLKSITLYPAQILGVEKELGSIDVGKRANLVLSNGNPMQASSQVQAIFIDGKPLEPTSKQTRLYDRYKERLREVQEGRSPLGTK